MAKAKRQHEVTIKDHAGRTLKVGDRFRIPGTKIRMQYLGISGTRRDGSPEVRVRQLTPMETFPAGVSLTAMAADDGVSLHMMESEARYLLTLLESTDTANLGSSATYLDGHPLSYWRDRLLSELRDAKVTRPTLALRKREVIDFETDSLVPYSSPGAYMLGARKLGEQVRDETWSTTGRILRELGDSGQRLGERHYNRG